MSAAAPGAPPEQPPIDPSAGEVEAVFLMTDIEGSSERWQTRPAAMASALARHDRIIAGAVERNGGRVVKHTGDGFFACFEGGDPLRCALEVQRAMAAGDWTDTGGLRVRIAVHSGRAVEREGDLFGADVSLTARLLSAAWGGQTLLTEEAAASLPLPPGAGTKDLGVHILRSFEVPRAILQLEDVDLPRAGFPPPRAKDARGAGAQLPPLAPLVGREVELGELCRLLLTPSTRLVSIVGAGGMGKTRLAQQVMAEIHPEFRYGSCFVPLAPLDRPDSIAEAIGGALKLRMYGPEEPLEQVERFLRDRKMLLVLDNLEHLAGAPDIVSRLVASAPLVTFLVTSRERLGIPCEIVFEIGGLECPPPGSFESGGDFGAVKLFLESARAQIPDYRPSGPELESISRLAILLQGMPLALELAAGWARLMSPSEILDETAKSLDFLESVQRGIPERHRSLRAVFEYSWLLLSPAEREALARLSVFRNRFDRASAARVSLAGPPVLLGLLDKSLVRTSSPGSFELVEVVRQYAREKLSADGEDELATLDRHASCILSWVSTSGLCSMGEEKRGALKAASSRAGDIRSAWKRALERGMLADLADAAPGLYSFLDSTCAYSEGEELFRELSALASGTPECDPALRGRIMAWHGWMSYRRASYALAGRILEEAVAILEPLDQPGDTGFALCGTGLIFYSLGQSDSLMQAFRKAHSYAARSGRRDLMARTETGMGLGHYLRKEYEEARARFEEAIRLYAESGDISNHPLAYTNLAFTEIEAGRLDEAEDLVRKSLECAESLGDDFGRGSAARALGMIEMRRGRCAEAEALLHRSMEMYGRIGYDLGVAICEKALAEMFCSSGQWARARDYCAGVASRARGRDCQIYLADILNFQGVAEKEAGNVLSAARCHEEALRRGREKGDRSAVGESLLHIARLASEDGRSELAELILEWLASSGEVPAQCRDAALSALAEKSAAAPADFEGSAGTERHRDLDALIAEVEKSLPTLGTASGQAPGRQLG